MKLDPENLRRQYASLSDEALLEMEREDLVPVAQQCYDEEVAGRKLGAKLTGVAARAAAGPMEVSAEANWQEDAAEVYSHVVMPGSTPAGDAADARDALIAAGIPCKMEVCEIPHDTRSHPEPTERWRVLVPGKLNLLATNVLERDIFNADFEEQWRGHLELLEDDELEAMAPEVVFCGLFDRIERVTRAYEEEVARREREL